MQLAVRYTSAFSLTERLLVFMEVWRGAAAVLNTINRRHSATDWCSEHDLTQPVSCPAAVAETTLTLRWIPTVPRTATTTADGIHMSQRIVTVTKQKLFERLTFMSANEVTFLPKLNASLSCEPDYSRRWTACAIMKFVEVVCLET